MVYVVNGRVMESRQQSLWRLSAIPEMFWSVVNFIGLFFQTMFQPDLTRRGRGYTSNYSPAQDGRGPPPGGPQRRMGGINHRSGPGAPPMAGGG